MNKKKLQTQVQLNPVMDQILKDINIFEPGSFRSALLKQHIQERLEKISMSGVREIKIIAKFGVRK